MMHTLDNCIPSILKIVNCACIVYSACPLSVNYQMQPYSVHLAIGLNCLCLCYKFCMFLSLDTALIDLSPHYVAITTNLFLHYVAVFPNQSHLLCEVKPKDVSTVPHQARSLVDILYTDYWTHVKYFWSYRIILVMHMALSYSPELSH